MSRVIKMLDALWRKHPLWVTLYLILAIADLLGLFYGLLIKERTIGEAIVDFLFELSILTVVLVLILTITTFWFKTDDEKQIHKSNQWHSTGETRWNPLQLRRLYSRVDDRVFVFSLLGLFVLAALWYGAFAGLRRLVYPDPGASGLIALPSGHYWVITTALVALVTGYAVLPLLLRLWLGRRYPEYRRYKKSKGKPALRLFILLLMATLGPGAVFLIYMSVTTYTVFAEDRIVIEHWHEGIRSYPYSKIAAIRAQQVVGSPDKAEKLSWYEIEFFDGYRWSADHAKRFGGPCRNYVFFAYAAQKSGQPITGPDLRAEEGCL